jgi:hypothetical protein
LCPPLFKEEVPEGRRSSRDESIFSKKLEIAPNPPFPRYATVIEETLGFFRIPSESYFPTRGLHFSYVYPPFPSGFPSFEKEGNNMFLQCP